jgi:hypothetical protein
MSKFRINENGKVYELTIITEDNAEVTNDFIGLYEAENGEVAYRLDADEAGECGYDYRIGGAGFEAMLDAFKQMEAEQDEGANRIIVWSDYR